MTLNGEKNRIDNSFSVTGNYKTLYWNFISFEARKLELGDIILDYDIVYRIETWLDTDTTYLLRNNKIKHKIHSFIHSIIYSSS